jgi:hypothetical protein
LRERERERKREAVVYCSEKGRARGQLKCRHEHETTERERARTALRAERDRSFMSTKTQAYDEMQKRSVRQMSRCKFERAAVSVSDGTTGDAARVRQRQDAPSRRRAGKGCAARGTRCLAGWGSTCSWRWRPAFRRRGRSARKPSGSNNRSSTHWVVEVAGRAVGQVRLKVIAAGRAGGRIEDSHLVHLALNLDVPDREDEQAAEQAGKGVEVVEPGMQKPGDISQRTLRAKRRPVDAPVAPEGGDLRVGYEYATEGDQDGDDERVHLRARKEGERRNREEEDRRPIRGRTRAAKTALGE